MRRQLVPRMLGTLTAAALICACASPERNGDHFSPGTPQPPPGGGDDGSTGGAPDPGDDGEPETFDVPGEDGTGGNGDEIEGCQAVDLVFVIDDSGSMADEQQNLIASFDGFINGIQDKLRYQSYHVGVIASDAYPGNEAGCQKLGSLVTATSGNNSSESSCGPFAGGGRFMTQADDLVDAFSCAAQLGTDGSGNEQPMEALTNALNPAAAGLGSCNDGFLRDDALLVVVTITDEEDDLETMPCNNNPFGVNGGSDGDPSSWYQVLVDAKGGREEGIVMLSLVGPTGPDPAICPPLDKCADAIIGAEAATRLVDLTQRFSWGFVGRVCDPDYGDFFNDAIDNIVEACDAFPPEG